MPANGKATVEDIGNIVQMEHVNVFVPDQVIATWFYIVGMGFTRDPYMMVGPDNMWANIGKQQFHLPTRGTQVLPGHTGIVTPDLAALKQRLQNVEKPLAGTKFAWSDEGDHVAVTCPWGNAFRCYEPRPEFGDMQLGIPYVEFLVKPGTADGIARFYKQAMDAPAKVDRATDLAVAIVQAGPDQVLRFQETTDPLPDYDGHHIAVYVANFSKPYNFFAKRDLVMEEIQNHQFRFKEIIDPKSGEHLLQLEHEVRGLLHPMYDRPMVNRNPAQSIRGYVRWGDAFLPKA